MYVFNTTFLVSDRVYGAWVKWVREEHLPFMMDSGYFSKPQVAKVLTEGQEGTSFSVQFHVESIPVLQQWNARYAVKFQQIVKEKFGEEALFFTTLLELID